MVARLRPINWGYLVNPTMQGLQQEGEASQNLSRMVFGGLSEIGTGIVRGRQEAESKRRFGVEQDRMARNEARQARRDELLDLRMTRQENRADTRLGMEQARFDLEKQRYDEDLLDRKGAEEFVLKQVQSLTGAKPSSGST